MSFEQLLAQNDLNNASIKAWKEGGGHVMGTICCHVPEELLDAVGVLPIHLRATGCTDSSEGEAWMSPFSCSFAKSVLQYLLEGKYDYLDGIVASDGCLMAGRIYDNYRYADKEKLQGKKFYLRQIDVPRMNKGITLEFFVKELGDLKKELEEFTENVATEKKLKEAVEVYNETRTLIQALYELRKSKTTGISGEDALKITLAAMTTPKREYNKMLKAYLEEAKKLPPITGKRARLMIIGSALDDPEYIKVIEDAGALIVTDVNCFGSRYLWEPVKLEGDTLTSIARSYLEKPTCPRMCNMHDEVHEFIHQMAKDYGVDGIVYAKLQYCEVWGGEGLHFEDKIKEWGIPLLTLEREEIMTNVGQLKVRAEAFIEMLEGGKK